MHEPEADCASDLEAAPVAAPGTHKSFDVKGEQYVAVRQRHVPVD